MELPKLGSQLLSLLDDDDGDDDDDDDDDEVLATGRH